MSNLRDGLNVISQQLAHKSADLEDAAVAQYIKSQADYLIAKGEDLTKYELVRGDGVYELENNTITGRVRYGLIKSENITEVEPSHD